MTNEKNKSYFQYFARRTSSQILDKLITRKREEIYDIFIKTTRPSATDRVLDVGASSNEHISSNMLEKLYPYTQNITALGVDELPNLESEFPGLTYVRGDGKDLPFPDDAFDITYSHAVIEHVGSNDNQEKFISEIMRVSRKGFFITTPDRSHPLELHTGLPLIHWLPKAVHRRIYKLAGKKFYSAEDNLNLLNIKELGRLITRTNGDRYQIDFFSIRFLGIKSNIIVAGTSLNLN